MNMKETLSDFLTLYYVFLFFFFIKDLVVKDRNLKEITEDFMKEGTIFRIIFLTFSIRLVPLIVLTLNIIELNLSFLDRED